MLNVVFAFALVVFGQGAFARSMGVGQYSLPEGNYYQTCQRCEWDGRFLSCTCRRSDGSWNDTTLDVGRRCPVSTLQNIEGHLRCDYED